MNGARIFLARGLNYIARKLHPQVAARPRLDLSVGTLSGEELDLLRRLVGRAQQIEGPIVEIGTLAGATALDVCSVKALDKELICVDNFAWNPWGLTPQEHRALTRHSLNAAKERMSVTLIESDKEDFYNGWQQGAPSLVLLDAIHTYEHTSRDIRWARKVNSAIICGHDYSDEFPGVMRAVDEAGGPSEVVGTVWVLTK